MKELLLFVEILGLTVQCSVDKDVFSCSVIKIIIELMQVVTNF